jgi:hypothetical protein
MYRMKFLEDETLYCRSSAGAKAFVEILQLPLAADYSMLFLGENLSRCAELPKNGCRLHGFCI